VSKVIYCIRQLFENTIDRKCLIESILTNEYCQSNHIFRLSDSIHLRIDPLVRWQDRMIHAVTRINRVNDENLSNQSDRASDTRILQAY